jgi:hypothetical protein
MASRIASLLKRRGQGQGDELPTTSDDGEKHSMKLGRRRDRLSLAKYMLAFAGAVLMIFHQLRSKGMIKPHLRVMTRSYLRQDWQKWSRHDFKKQFQCSHHLSVGTKAVPTLEYWQTLRDVYNSEVDSSFAFDDPVPPTQGYTLNENGRPPYYADISPGKGRGLFASRDIKEGELVDGIESGTKSDMIFTTVNAIRRYLLALPEPMACDVLEWTYTEKIVKEGPAVLLCASDISSLMNSAWDDDVDANVMPKDKSSSVLLYATRDIKKGEEILMNYGVFEAGIW